MPIVAVEHVQLAMPPGMEQAALLVADLEALISQLKAHNVKVIDDDPLEGYLRVYVADPFGNRIELMEPRNAS